MNSLCWLLLVFWVATTAAAPGESFEETGPPAADHQVKFLSEEEDVKFEVEGRSNRKRAVSGDIKKTYTENIDYVMELVTERLMSAEPIWMEFDRSLLPRIDRNRNQNKNSQDNKVTPPTVDEIDPETSNKKQITSIDSPQLTTNILSKKVLNTLFQTFGISNLRNWALANQGQLVKPTANKKRKPTTEIKTNGNIDLNELENLALKIKGNCFLSPQDEKPAAEIETNGDVENPEPQTEGDVILSPQPGTNITNEGMREGRQIINNRNQRNQEPKEEAIKLLSGNVAAIPARISRIGELQLRKSRGFIKGSVFLRVAPIKIQPSTNLKQQPILRANLNGVARFNFFEESEELFPEIYLVSFTPSEDLKLLMTRPVGRRRILNIHPNLRYRLEDELEINYFQELLQIEISELIKAVLKEENDKGSFSVQEEE